MGRAIGVALQIPASECEHCSGHKSNDDPRHEEPAQVDSPSAVTSQDEVMTSPDDATRASSSSSHIHLPRREQAGQSRND